MRWHHYQRFIGVILVAWSLLFTSFAQAQALPAYNGRVNAAVGGIVSAKLGKWGFAANDPRITATASGIGTGLTTLAVGVATGAVATVGWPALLVAAGVSALVGGGVSLAVDGLYKWIFNSDGTVSTSSPGGSSGSPGGSGMVADGPFFQSGAYAAGDGETAAKEWAYKTWGANGVLNGGFYDSSGNYWFFIDYADSAEGHCAPYAHCRSEVSMKQNSGAPGNCAAGMVWDGACRALSSLPPPSGVSNVSPTAAVQDIPAAELAKPMSNEMLAAAANAAWKAAATNAGGLPWSASDPITPADVAQWRAANPSAVPTVGDMTAPIASGSAVSIGPSSAPGGSTSPSTGPAATPGSGTQVDFGPNPNTPAPGLEATPTAQQILSPLLNLMPDLKAFAVPAHVGTCPTPSFVAFDKTYTFESHCGLVESNRSLIEAAMMLVWAIAAVFIVLRA